MPAAARRQPGQRGTHHVGGDHRDQRRSQPAGLRAPGMSRLPAPPGGQLPPAGPGPLGAAGQPSLLPAVTVLVLQPVQQQALPATPVLRARRPAGLAPGRGHAGWPASPQPPAAAGSGPARPGNPRARPTAPPAPRRSPPAVPEQHVQRLGPVSGGGRRADPLPGLPHLPGVMGQQPADDSPPCGESGTSCVVVSRACPSTNCTDVILSFRVSQGCDLRRPVVDSVADGTLAA